MGFNCLLIVLICIETHLLLFHRTCMLNSLMCVCHIFPTKGWLVGCSYFGDLDLTLTASQSKKPVFTKHLSVDIHPLGIGLTARQAPNLQVFDIETVTVYSASYKNLFYSVLVP